MGFSIFDSSGNLKTSGGAGGSPHALLDAVYDSDTLAHAPAAGDLVIANATPKWTGLAAASNGDFLNLQSGLPAWVHPNTGLLDHQPRSRKVGASYPYPGSTTAIRYGMAEAGAWSTQAGGASVQQDTSDAHYYQHTGVSVIIRLGTTTAWCRLDHDPLIELQILTGAALSAGRFWWALMDAAPTNADNQAARKGVGMRYSIAGGSDTGFMLWSANGSTQTIGAAVSGGTITTNARYLLRIRVTGGGANFSCSINNGTEATAAIPAAALGTNMLSMLVWNSDTSNLVVSEARYYCECNS